MSRIPLASACLIGHNPKGALPIRDGGHMSQACCHQLDYNGCHGRYEAEEKCDRSMTLSDEDLHGRLRESGDMSRQVDYVARLGEFAGKDAGQQVDCTFWGQWGPVDEDALRAEMLHDGGAFMKSIVVVKREYAHDLGIESKEDFENLMRATWNKAVMAWGVTDDPNNIRWVANYHTNAEESIHVHVTTWLADGSMQNGWTVTAAGTREAKATVYREAYREVLVDRSREKDCLRDVLRVTARREMGVAISKSMLDRTERKCAEAGRELIQGPTLDEDGRRAVQEKMQAVRAAYEAGEGRISRNYELRAAASELMHELERRSAPFAEAMSEYRGLIEDRADANGLAVAEETEDGSRSKAAEVIQHERDQFIRQEMDDIRYRVSRDMIDACRNVADESARRDMEHELQRDVTNGVVRDAAAPLGPDGEDRVLGMDHDRAVEVRNAMREVAECRDEGAHERAREAARMLVLSPEVQQRLDKAVEAAEGRAAKEGCEVPRDLRADLERSTEDRFTAQIEHRAADGTLDPDREIAREAARDALRDEGNRAVERSISYRALHDQGIDLGLTRSQHREVERLVGEAREAHSRGASMQSEEVRAPLRQAARIVSESPRVAEAVRTESRNAAGRNGADPSRVYEKTQEETRTKVESSFARTVEYGRDEGGIGIGGFNSIAQLAESIAKSLSHEEGNKPERSYTHDRNDEKHVQMQQGNTRSR